MAGLAFLKHTIFCLDTGLWVLGWETVFTFKQKQNVALGNPLPRFDKDRDNKILTNPYFASRLRWH